MASTPPQSAKETFVQTTGTVTTSKRYAARRFAPRRFAPGKAGTLEGTRAATGLHTRADEAFADWDLPTAAARVEAGLPSEALVAVRRRLDLSKLSLALALGISESTVERRKPGTRLPPAESERVYRLGRLADLAERALGSPDEARAWMKEPNYTLGDAVPIELARTEPGARLVERALAGLAYGLPA